MRAIWWLISIGIVAITILGGPPAISLISQLTDWRSSLEGPVAQWNRSVEEIGQQLPLVSSLPIWMLNIIYLLLLFGSMGWIYISSVAAETRRLIKVASTGALDPVEPLSLNRPIREMVVWGTSILGILGGTITIGIGVGTLNPVVIAGGVAAIYGGAGALTVEFLTDAIERAKRNDHAEAQSLRQAESRRARVQENVDAFRRSEMAKLGIGGAVAVALALANFAIPALYSLFEHLDFS